MPPLSSSRVFAGFDLETTGVIKHQDRIIQYSLITVDRKGRDIVPPQTGLVNPGIPIPDEAASIHGITTERVQVEGWDPFTALSKITARLAAVALDMTPLVIFNAQFDMTVYMEECERHGVDPVDPTMLSIYDPLVVSRNADRYRKGGHRLSTLAEAFGIPEDWTAAHDATIDARMAVWLTIDQMARWPQVTDELDTMNVNGAMAAWYEIWRADFEHYLRRLKDNPAYRIGRGWPVEDPAYRSTD